MELKFGNVEQTWPQYKLSEAEILYDEQNTGWKAILKEDQFISMVRHGYKLLPNEEALKAANQVAEAIGFKPFEQYQPKGTRLYAVYLRDEAIPIDNRDKVRVGFSVQNSIDGALSFSGSGFTFREMCSNGVFLGFKKLEETQVYRRHTKNLSIDLDGMKRIVEQVVLRTRKAVARYIELTQVKLNEEIANKIARGRLPRKYLPDYIEVEKDRLINFNPNMDQWETYNDISAAIWHNAQSEIETKRNQLRQLNEVFVV